MRDQIDAMIWNEHHDQFSEWMGGALTRLGGRLSSYGAAPAAGQLFAAVAAVGLTLATLGVTTA